MSLQFSYVPHFYPRPDTVSTEWLRYLGHMTRSPTVRFRICCLDFTPLLTFHVWPDRLHCQGREIMTVSPMTGHGPRLLMVNIVSQSRHTPKTNWLLRSLRSLRWSSSSVLVLPSFLLHSSLIYHIQSKFLRWYGLQTPQEVVPVLVESRRKTSVSTFVPQNFFST